MKKEPTDMGSMGEAYLTELMKTEDPEILRGMLFEMLVVIGNIYRRLQFHVLLHPVFFLTGFVSSYLLLR